MTKNKRPKQYIQKTWLTWKDLETYLDLSTATVARLLRRRKIPAHRVGKLWRFHREEIDAWLLKN